MLGPEPLIPPPGGRERTRDGKERHQRNTRNQRRTAITIEFRLCAGSARDGKRATSRTLLAKPHQRALSCFLLPPSPPTFICLFRSPAEARLASAMQMRNAAPLRVSMRFLRLDRFQPNVPTPEGLIKISETRPTLNLSPSIASRRASGCIILLNRDPASAARYRCSDAFPARLCLRSVCLRARGRTERDHAYFSDE